MDSKKSCCLCVDLNIWTGNSVPFRFYNTSNGDEKKPADESKLPVSSEELTLDTGILDERSERDKVVGKLMEEAEVQSYTKFGSKIKPVIEDEFRIAILPNIEKAINNVTSSFPDEDLSQLTVTEMPSPGTSERIFHIVKENQDVIRFHVRRDRPRKMAIGSIFIITRFRIISKIIMH